MKVQQPDPVLIVGRNVNMVAGRTLPDGDPYLQRQNEPSGAASTRNPLHLLFGSNDYRTVDIAQSEGPLPGVPEGAAAGDAWLGVFKSYNGGESWKTSLLPGYPQDLTAEGARSPLFGIGAASDPTVRAGANGMFYYSGIAFDRVEHGRSVIFVARFIDNNLTESGDPDSIKYLDTTLIDEGTSGQFADKPWIAVDMPRYGGETVPINAPNTGVQNVARHNVYIVYSIFLGSSGGGGPSKIMFARSTDCGRTWERPIKLSESQHLNQGTTIGISPLDGRIILTWRRYASTNETHALMACISDDFGRTFTKPAEIVSINPFDQFTGAGKFRTTAFPALAVDHNGIAYVAWSQRGLGPHGEARIVIEASKDGVRWSGQVPVDNHPAGGHQIMPSLTFAGGRLMMTWYDTRKSLGYVDQNGDYHHTDEITDPGPTGKRHTLDVWVAQAFPSNPGLSPPSSPSFTDSTQVSRYLYQAKTQEPEGWLLDEDDNPVHMSGKPA
ncbi:MAG: glycoside hydrolase, partial [Candidatus Aminicenantes bacterium]|nr:glycoside hydrolase [Candidatus Aminicenantes bacterium]